MLEASDQPLLLARNVTKTFGATTALRALDFTLWPGRVHALIGENGAGKSTFIKVLAGLHQADEGTIDIVHSSGGEPVIAFIHQDLGLIPGMSAAENVILGSHYPKKGGFVSWAAVKERARESLLKIGAAFDPETPIEQLGVADRALVAIARAIRQNARILVLDEPTATLPGNDVHKLFSVLKQLKQDGIGMIYVSHRLREVLAIADELTVVRDGRLSFHGPVAGMTEAQVIGHMIGAEFSSTEATRGQNATGNASVLLDVQNLACQNLRIDELVVRRGEIIGCVGLRGAGQDVLGRALAAILPATGETKFDGSDYRPRSIDDAIKRGISFVTGDRDLSITRTMTLTENLFIHPPRSTLPNWLRGPRAERRSAEETIRNYDVRPRLPNKLIGELSGGNAQKLVFARGLESRPKLMILDEPTAGVDMPTRHALYKLMREIASEGTAFLVASSDHDEVATICDRVHIFRDGRICQTLDHRPFDAENIASLAQENPA